MTDNLFLTNYKSQYIKTLSNNGFDNKKHQGSFALLEGKGNIAASNHQSQNNKDNFGYYSGVAATIGQAAAGLLMLPTSFLERLENEKSKLEIEKLPKNLSELERKEEAEKIIGNYGESIIERIGKRLSKKEKYKSISEKILRNGTNLHKFAKKVNHFGWISLGLSYLVSIPSCIGAGLEVKQPNMLLGALAWAAAAPFMMMKRFEDSPRLKGFTLIGYALTYCGLANKIKNDNEVKKGETKREFDFKGNKGNSLSNIIKFSIQDHLSLPESLKNAFKQTKEYFSGKRKAIPDFLSPDPTSDNRKLSSLLLYAGGIPLIIFGQKNKVIKNAANIMIGTGLLLDAIGMFAIGRKEKGATKAILLGGVPLRAIGDFAQTNKFMYGLRTLGGSSFEYYFASLNQNKDSKETKPEPKV